MTWWEEFASRLIDPSWAAGVLSSLVGTAIAFFGAVYLVRRQLRHDRELVTAQLHAISADRVAERRSEAAGRLGRTLVMASGALDIYNVKGLLARARTAERPDGEQVVYDAEDEAQLVLDLDTTVLDLWREMNHTWDVCRTAVRLHDGLTRTPSTETALSHAVEATMMRPRVALDQLGRALIRWNGVGPVPSVEVLDGWTPIPVSDHKAHRRWRAEIQKRFEFNRLSALRRRE